MDHFDRHATLVRFNGDVAVLLIEEDGEIVDEARVKTVDLPSAGRHQNAIFAVYEEGEPDQFILHYLPHVTARQKKKQDVITDLEDQLTTE